MKFAPWFVRSWLLVATPLVCTTLLSPSAHADAADDKLADKRLDAGKKAYAKKRYEAARKALLEADQLRADHAETTFYLGMAASKTKKPGEAARYLKKYLAATQSESTPQRDEAEATLATVRKKLGTLVILAPRATDITLDSTEALGTAPIEPIDVEPGEHSVMGRTHDGASLAQDVRVKAGEKLTVKLGDPNSGPPAPGTEDEGPEIPTLASDDKPVKHSGPGLFSPPKTMAPVYVSLGVAVLGGAGALLFGLSRGNAEKAADEVESKIIANGGGPGTCASSDAAITQKFGQPCGLLADNRSAVDQNALLTNVSFVVAGVGAAAALGLYMFLPKQESASPTTARRPVVIPVRYSGGAGLGVVGEF